MRKPLFSHRKPLFLLFFLASGALFFWFASSSHPPPKQETITERLSPQTTLIPADADAPFVSELTILEGERFLDLIARAGVKDPRAIAFLKTNEKTEEIARSLRPGRIVTATTDKNGLSQSLLFATDLKDQLLAVQKEGDHFVALEKKIALLKETISASIEIENSLFGATDKADIPESVAVGLAQVFESDIDFYRDLRKGDRFALVYESLSYEGRLISGGKILAATYEGERKNLKAFWKKLIYMSH